MLDGSLHFASSTVTLVPLLTDKLDSYRIMFLLVSQAFVIATLVAAELYVLNKGSVHIHEG